MVMVCVMLVVVNPHGFGPDDVEFYSNFTASLYNGLDMLAFILMIAAVLLTVISLMDYLVKNKEVMKDVE